MNERLSQIQTGLLAGILVVLVVIAVEPSGQPAAQGLDYTSDKPLPVEVVAIDKSQFPLEVIQPNGCGYSGHEFGLGQTPCQVVAEP